MAEKDTIFSSTIKFAGIFTFKDFYQFCYDWLTEETGLEMAEIKYEEKIKGEKKDIEVKWEGDKKITDYFRFDIQIGIKMTGMEDVEVMKEGIKIQTNKGYLQKLEVKGILTRDYDGKFETTASKKLMRSIYEKWVIPSRIDEMEDKVAEDCDKFLNQAKAWLDLEGKK